MTRIENLSRASTEELEDELLRLDDIPVDGDEATEASLAEYGDQIEHILDSRGAGIPDFAAEL